MELRIEQRAANVMLMDDIDVHTVKMPNIWLFAKFSGITKEWPTLLTYRERKYKFVGQEPLPSINIGTYSGHAKYELVDEEKAKAPVWITHKEFGAVLEVIGNAMRAGNVSMNEALAESSFDIAECLQAKGVDAERAVYVTRKCTQTLIGLNTKSVPDETGE